jgi:hypothetical protein
MSESDLPELCEKDGFVMDRDFAAELGRQHHGDIWPMESYAAGVNPVQIPEMREIDKKHGVPTDYTTDGDPVFRGPAHRKKYLEVHGMYDRNAGYRDPVPARCR